MNNQQREYISTLSDTYNLMFMEVYALFIRAVAKAYKGVGSAYIYEDGTILVAMADTSKKRIYNKHYVISAKKYEEINKIFIKLLEEYSAKRDTLHFASSVFNKIIKTQVIKETDKSYIVSPVIKKGKLRSYKFVLSKSFIFYDESFEVGDEIDVVCKSFNFKEKYIRVSRLDRVLCSKIFRKMFHKLNKTLDENFSYKRLRISFDYEEKIVRYKIRWGNIPNSYFIKLLNERLNMYVKRAVILFKEKGGENGEDRE